MGWKAERKRGTGRVSGWRSGDSSMLIGLKID